MSPFENNFSWFKKMTLSLQWDTYWFSLGGWPRNKTISSGIQKTLSSTDNPFQFFNSRIWRWWYFDHQTILCSGSILSSGDDVWYLTGQEYQSTNQEWFHQKSYIKLNTDDNWCFMISVKITNHSWTFVKSVDSNWKWLHGENRWVKSSYNQPC